MTSREAAYISSGTWSLVGMELDEPVLTGASRTANFTNEGGVDGRIRYLRNAMGMWVLNECVDAWRREDEEAELERVLDDAARASRWVVFDVDHPSLVPAGDMPSRVERLVTDAGQTRLSRGELVRSILESLAHSYAVTLDELEALTGVAVDAVHLVGGGSQNPLLCQLVADHSAAPWPPVRSRPRRSATSSSKRARRDWSRATWRPSGCEWRPPFRLGGTSRRPDGGSGRPARSTVRSV
jgi:rhamnulokinase